MRVNLQCNIQTLQDAMAKGSINVVCEVIKKCRDIIGQGGKVCVYNEYQAPVDYRQDKVFTSLDEFNNWVVENFSDINCD